MGIALDYQKRFYDRIRAIFSEARGLTRELLGMSDCGAVEKVARLSFMGIWRKNTNRIYIMQNIALRLYAIILSHDT